MDTATELEVLKKKLSDMEKENTALKKELGRKSRVSLLPYEIRSKYPLIEDGFCGATFPSYISQMIRHIVFYETRKNFQSSQGTVGQKFVTCQAMDNNQYSLYLETVDTILSALSNGREKALRNKKDYLK